MTVHGDQLDSKITELVTELKGLSSGKGVKDPNITLRIGATLRLVCGIPDGAGPERARELLVKRLHELSQVLCDGERLALMAAFGLDEDLYAPTKKDRIKKIVDRIERGERTADRWLHDACRRLAQVALDGSPPAPVGIPSTPWHTKSVEVAMVLDLATPEIHERRTIVADQDDLDEVELSLTWALLDGQFDQSDLDGLEVDVLYGGMVVTRVLRASRRVGFVLRLPHPLGRNKEHEYAFRIKLDARHPIEPYYVCTPRYPCESFRLRVRFRPDQVPNSVWKIHKTLPTEIGDSLTRRETASVDSCGEVHADFLDLAPNLSYGLRWSHEVTPAGGDPAPH